MNKPIEILIVDDEDLLRTTLAYSVREAGYIVNEASSAIEAIAIIEESSSTPMVILLDMGMPPNKHTSEEGMKVLNFVSDNQLPMKVIVLTGQDAEKTAYLSIVAGAFDYIQKPAVEEKLLDAIHRAVLFHEQIEKMQQQDNQQNISINVNLGEGVKKVRNQAEEKILRKVLQKTEFNVHETGRQLGLKRENVYYLIKKYKIKRPTSEEVND